MKRISLLLSALLMLFMVSCDPDGTTPTPDPDPEPTVIPTSFTKKVMVEKFTGEWCGNCPGGQRSIQDAAAANSGRVFAMAIHKKSSGGGGDRYENAASSGMYQTLTSELRHPGMSSIGFPTIIIDRAPGSNGQVINGFSSGTTTTGVAARLAEEVKCGLAMESTLSGDKADLKVKFVLQDEYNDPLFLYVAVLEDDLDGSLQASGGGAGYKHKHVLREMLTPHSGTSLPRDQNEILEVEFTDIDLSGYDASNVEFVAYIVQKGSAYDAQRVLNVQGTHAGENHDFD